MNNQRPYYSGLDQHQNSHQYFKQDSHHTGLAYQPSMVSSDAFPLGGFTSHHQIEMVERGEFSGLGESTQGSLLRKSGLQILEEHEGVFIKQKLNLVGAITGCETQNTYYVYPPDPEAIKKGHKLFKCQEKSSFCIRNCVSGGCRPFKMTISTFRRGEDQKDEYEPFLSLERPCKCTCLCYQRPELFVRLVEDGKNEYLGKIVDMFTWCSLKTNVLDKDNLQINTIESNGIMWKGPCQTETFRVKTPSGEILSTLQRKSPGCLKATFTDVNNFALNFPAGAMLSQKALLLSAILLIDYCYFEQSGGQ